MYDTTAEISAPNPWISIWTAPRATIRYVINTDPARSVIPLAILGEIAQSLSQAISQGMGEQLSIPAILLFAAVIGSVFGILALYIGSYVIQWTGRWIGGEGSLPEIRTALGWAGVPMVLHLVITLLMIPVLGRMLFLGDVSKAQLLHARGCDGVPAVWTCRSGAGDLVLRHPAEGPGRGPGFFCLEGLGQFHSRSASGGGPWRRCRHCDPAAGLMRV